MNRRDLLKAGIALPALATTLAAPRLARAQAARTLRFVPYADIAVVDPHFSTAYTVRTHALAVFDTLYGTDENFQAHPQMVAGHVVSADQLIWTLTLRPGLVFHDDTPVLARDCVASIQRWGKRDAFGQSLMAVTEELSAPDDRTIRFRLKKPFPLLPQALGRASSLVPAIMPARLAETDAFKQVTEVVGSGPYRFLANDRIPGARVAYARHEKYVPRPDGVASFTAGPRVAHFDRLEFNVIPDAATAANALITGDVDWVEQPMIDLLPGLRRNRDIVVEVKDPSGMNGQLRFNHLFPPFDNPAVRRVVLKAVSQTDCMTAVAGSDRSIWSDKVGIFSPASALASDAGMEKLNGSQDFASLRQELVEAGYKGEKVVFLAGADVPRTMAVCEVTAALMRRLGFNVDFIAADWGTVVQRILIRRPIDQGGWSAYCTYWSGLDQMNPATHSALRGNGAAAGPGWPSSPKIEALRDRWFDAADLAEQQALCREIQLQAWEDVPFIQLGQFTQPVAYRRNLTGMLKGAPVFTNLRKV
ncbi:ABC transporter substrate-binding protein [Roseomonas sp. 18066]|uniref:ABC transporter substrate-binding protein n=1 Tax=Roseomonas sp. 18066 TaxID=2681412 RepID=UPI001359B972|nr:ABC transporter substrate-binding protein [Roseomonas sp. 18066]